MASTLRSQTAPQPRTPAPPSAFARRGGSLMTSSNQTGEETQNRRTSRVDMDFEQALKGGGTVVLEEGRRLDTLGVTTPRASSSRTPVTSKLFQQPATPTVVPPTPTSDSVRPRTADKKRATDRKASNSSSASSVPAETGLPREPSPSASPSNTPIIQHPLGLEDMDDVDLLTKRRSLFRSPGTSSSPDLATLVRKAKERGGVVGAPSSGAGDSGNGSSTRLDTSTMYSQDQPQASSSHLSPLLPSTGPSGSLSSQERVRTRTRSSTSSTFSLVSTPSPAEEAATLSAHSRRPKINKAEKVLGVAGRPMGNVASLEDPWSQNPEKAQKSSIRSKTTALWTKMTGSTRSRPSTAGSRTVPTTPITPTSALSPFSSFAQSPKSPRSDHPPPIPTVPSAWRSRPSTREDTYSDPRNPSGKPLPPIYNMVAMSPSEEEVDRVTGKPPRPPRKGRTASAIAANRRRSMSVDAVDLRQVLAMAGRISEDVGPLEKTQPAAPRETPRPTEGLLDGWSLNGAGDMSDLRGAVAGLGMATSKDDGSTTIKSKNSGRPRAYSASVPADPPPRPVFSQSMSTPSTPPVGLMVSGDEGNRSSLSDQTAMPSDRTTPEPSDLSTDDASPPSLAPKRSPSMRSTSARLQPPRRAQHGASLQTPSDSSSLRLQNTNSSSEPSLLPEHAPPPRRGSEDVNGLQRLQVSIDSPTPHRTVRMMTSPTRIRMGMDPSASSLEVSVYDYTGDPGSPIQRSPDGPEDLPAKAKALADRCWQEDDTFLTKEKIAEWIGGHHALNKLALTQYMNHFDFTGYRLDQGFRHLCQKLFLKAETQQVDRILEDFGRRYHECNPMGLFGSPGVVHSVAYSLLLLNTDLHVAELASHMSRGQFVRNTLFAITESVRPSSPSVAPNVAARASTPELSSPRGDDASSRKSGETSDNAPSTLRMRSKRSGSIHSWKSISREGLGGMAGNASTPALTTTHSPTSPALQQDRPQPQQPHQTFSRNSAHGSVNYGRTWEHDMETVLKEMYNAVKAQQILQPMNGAGFERQSTSSLTPGNSLVGRSRSQKSYGGAAALKRGSIRGIQSLLGSQSPYSSNSSSTDGRISPSPSFATSLGEAVSASSSSLFAPTLGFASNLSHTIIKEAQEDDSQSVTSANSEDTTVSMTDEELALQGPPWAKEGMLCRKQYWESTSRRAKDKNWADVFVVIQKGELSMFTFGGGGTTSNSGAVGGGNWLSNAQPMGTFSLAHSLAHSLPPPGYNRSRPHCFVLTLASDAVYFFQAGSEDLINEWVSTCNYWSARVSKEPLSGGVSNMEYGWSRVDQSSSSNTGHALERWETDQSDAFSVRSGRSRLSKKSLTDVLGAARSQYSPFAMEKIYINDWKPPMTSTMHSKSDEEVQLEALQKQVAALKADMSNHDKLHIPMQQLYQPRSPNHTKATANWEAKQTYLTHEIFKYETYVDSLRSAMTMRMKKRGEKVLERALVSSVDDETFPTVSARPSRKGLREETIQEAEEPVTPGPAATFRHTRELASVDISME